MTPSFLQSSDKRFENKFVHKGEDGLDVPEAWEWTILGAPIEVESFIHSEFKRLLEEVEKELSKRFIDFAEILKEKRMAMKDSDVGYMHGNNDTVDSISSFLDTLIKEI
jgi:hypothetical protein